MGRDRLRLDVAGSVSIVYGGGGEGARLAGVTGLVGAGLAGAGSVRELLARALCSLARA
jgi:hypothetical protein